MQTLINLQTKNKLNHFIFSFFFYIFQYFVFFLIRFWIPKARIFFYKNKNTKVFTKFYDRNLFCIPRFFSPLGKTQVQFLQTKTKKCHETWWKITCDAVTTNSVLVIKDLQETDGPSWGANIQAKTRRSLMCLLS